MGISYLLQSGESSQRGRGNFKSIYSQPQSIQDDLRYGINQPIAYHWQTQFPVAYDFTISPESDRSNLTHQFRIWYRSATEAAEGEQATNSISTGWSISPGLVVTLASNVFGASGIWIHDGQQTTPAEITAVDRESNLALLIVGNSDRSTLAISENSPEQLVSQLRLLSVHASDDDSQSTRTTPIQARLGNVRKNSGQDGEPVRALLDVAVSEPDRGAPIIGSSGEVVGLADVRTVMHRATDGTYSTSMQTGIIPIQYIHDMLQTYAIPIESSQARAFEDNSRAKAPLQPVVKIKAKNVDPIKRIAYRLDIQQASTGSIQSATGLSGTLYATKSGRTARPQNVDFSVPAVGSYPGMILFPLDTCRSNNWTHVEQLQFVVNESSGGFGAGLPSKSVPYTTLSNSNVSAEYSGESIVKIKSNTQRAIAFESGQTNLLEIVSNCEFDSTIGLPRTIEHRITTIKDMKPGKTYIVEARLLDPPPAFDATSRSITRRGGGRTKNNGNLEKE